MAYLPPHRRKKDGSAKREYYYPDADIDGEVSIPEGRESSVLQISTLGHASRIWFAVDANLNPPPDLKVSFKPFPDTSIPQLRGSRVFTLSVDDLQSDTRSLVNNDTLPWRYTSNKIKDDLRKCFYKLESCIKMSKANYARHAFTARFGNIIFHGSRLALCENFSLEKLEKMFRGQKVSPNPSNTFDTHIREDIFEAMKQKAIRSMASPTLKEKVAYLIMVSDDLNLDIQMVITCRKKDIDDKKIKLKKIELFTLKHFVADTSCLNKVMDWRLAVTEKYLVDLDEEDKECIEEIVKSACIDVSAKGGLVWPPGSLVIKRNRFHIIGTWTLNVTTIVGKTWDIKFQHANRIQFEDSKEIEDSWRVSNEIDLKLKGISKYLREQREWEEENIMNILEDSLKWVWMEALS